MKKHSFEKLLRVLVVLVLLYDMIQALAALMMWKGRRLEQSNQGKRHKRYLSFMDGYSRRLKDEAVEEVDLTAVMGGIELDLTGAKLAERTQIRVKSVMSGVIIKVPPMVEVREDARSVMSGIANMVPQYHKEGLPVIFLQADCLMSGVNVKVICEEKTEDIEE